MTSIEQVVGEETLGHVEPRLPWWARSFLVLVGTLAAVASGFLWGALVDAIVPHSPHTLPSRGFPGSLVVSALVGATGLAVAWALVRVVDGRPIRSLGLVLTPASLPLWLVGLVASLAIVLGGGVLAAASGELPPPALPLDPSWGGLLLLLGAGVVAQAFPQELLWRGYLLQTLRDRPLLGLLISANFFGLVHFVTNWAEPDLLARMLRADVAGALGALAVVLVVALRSWWPAFGVHVGLVVGSHVLASLGIGVGTVLWGLQTLLFLVAAGVVYALNRKAFTRSVTLER